VLEYKRNLFEETISEKQRLLKEKRALLDMLTNVQNDLEQLVDIEKTLAKENEQLEKQVLHLKTERYDPLHGKMDPSFISRVYFINSYFYRSCQ
jgi:predicted nuclease with TOPRIM domain